MIGILDTDTLVPDEDNAIVFIQLGEHLLYKQKVIGSSSISPIYGWVPELVKRGRL